MRVPEGCVNGVVEEDCDDAEDPVAVGMVA